MCDDFLCLCSSSSWCCQVWDGSSELAGMRYVIVCVFTRHAFSKVCLMFNLCVVKERLFDERLEGGVFSYRYP